MHLWASVQVLCIMCFAYDVRYQVRHGIACLEITSMLYACMVYVSGLLVSTCLNKEAVKL